VFCPGKALSAYIREKFGFRKIALPRGNLGKGLNSLKSEASRGKDCARSVLG